LVLNWLWIPRTILHHSFKIFLLKLLFQIGFKQVAVNLIDQKKAEGRLERQFGQLFNSSHNLEGIHYLAFDFHKECSKMRYERLSILIDQLSKYDMSYFYMPDKGANTKPLLTQVLKYFIY